VPGIGGPHLTPFYKGRLDEPTLRNVDLVPGDGSIREHPPIPCSARRRTPKKTALDLAARVHHRLRFAHGVLYAGPYILGFLQISQTALGLAGGVVLFLIALRMIFPVPGGMFGPTPEGEPFIVPIAIPLITVAIGDSHGDVLCYTQSRPLGMEHRRPRSMGSIHVDSAGKHILTPCPAPSWPDCGRKTDGNDSVNCLCADAPIGALRIILQLVLSLHHRRSLLCYPPRAPARVCIFSRALWAHPYQIAGKSRWFQHVNTKTTSLTS